ncbi:MAG: MATE family efflux transporter, partial [Bacteroidota bacterium]
MKKRDLTEGSIRKHMTNMTIPMIFGILSMVAFNLIDTYFVGQLGPDQLAALSFTFPVIMVIFSLVQGIGIGATALISKSIGKNDHKKAARETTDSLILGVLIASVFVILGLLTIQPTFKLLGASERIMPYIEDYMTLWYLAILFVVIPFIGNSAIRATGDARTPSLIMLFAVAINAILDPLLIFGYGPFPAMGIEGAALATAISRAMTLVLAIFILYKREKLITLDIPAKSILYGCWRSILYIGLPSGFSRMVTPLASGVVTGLLARYSESAVAAYGVGTRIEFLASSVLIALSAAVGPFTGQNLGAQKYDRIKSCINGSNQFSLVWAFGMSLLMLPFTREIASVFTNSEDVIGYIDLFLWIV